MPVVPPKPCRKSGCPEYQIRDGFCDLHAKEIKRQYEETRESASKRGYGRRWARVRKMKFRRNPICERCEAKEIVIPTEIVHHRDGNPRNNHMENLESLCLKCHNEEHKEERWGEK